MAFDVGHFLHMDQPEAFAATVRAFLDELRDYPFATPRP